MSRVGDGVFIGGLASVDKFVVAEDEVVVPVNPDVVAVGVAGAQGDIDIESTILDKGCAFLRAVVAVEGGAGGVGVVVDGEVAAEGHVGYTLVITRGGVGQAVAVVVLEHLGSGEVVVAAVGYDREDIVAINLETGDGVGRGGVVGGEGAINI